MRLFSAIIVSGILLTSNAAWAIPRDEAPQERNAIEWFLSDLGSLLHMAVKAIDQEPNIDASAQTDTVSSVATQFSADIDADLFGSANFDPVLTQDISANQSQNSTEPKQTISGFFETILAFLNQNAQPGITPTAEADDDIASLNPVVNNAPVELLQPKNEKPADLTEIVAPAVDRPEVDLFAVFQDAAVAYQNDESIEPKKNTAPALDGFFASLGQVFTRASSDAAPEDVAAINPPEETDTPPQMVDSSKATDQEVVVKTADEPQQVADVVPYEPAPWQFSPHVAVFAPEADIFDSSKASVPALIAPKTQNVQTVEMAQAEPVIRKRAWQNPAKRNHLSLGRTKTADLPEDDSGFFDHLIETFVGESDSTANQSEVLANKIPDRLIPEENLDLGYIAPDAARDSGPTDELTTIGDSILKNIDLYLGTNTVIGRRFEPTSHPSNACVERSLQVSVFCVAEIKWPAEIASSFAQDTAFTLPGEGVIRYENGRVSRVYTPFKANDFAEVVKFMQRKFGPPLEREIVWMHMIESPKMPNTTFRWRAVSADRKDSVVLEVRNFDDLRRSFADLDRGMVRLYRDGSRPIFKHLSTMDLMLIQRRRVSQAPAVPSADTAAN